MDNEINKDLYSEISVEKENKGPGLMEEPFNPSEINILIKSPTISLLIDRLSQKSPEIDLYTDFQRRDDLWTDEQQSQLIESILIKFPLPAFYFDGTDDERWLVVDGLQRLSALRNFIIEKKLCLCGLEFLKDLEGKKYDDLSRTLKREINQTQVIAYIINPGTPVNVKFNIFKRINTGGLVLEPQEIRHALNQGVPARFVADLAQLDEFKQVTENKIKTSRMLDREFVMRFVAFYINKPISYVPDLDTFLNNAMAHINLLTDEERVTITKNFTNAMITANKIFGNWAFRKADSYPNRRKPLNKALFEVWSVCLAKLSVDEQETLVRKKDKVIHKFVEICEPYSSFWSSISSSTGEKARIIERFSQIERLINEVLND